MTRHCKRCGKELKNHAVCQVCRGLCKECGAPILPRCRYCKNCKKKHLNKNNANQRARRKGDPNTYNGIVKSKCNAKCDYFVECNQTLWALELVNERYDLAPLRCQTDHPEYDPAALPGNMRNRGGSLAAKVKASATPEQRTVEPD